MSSFRVYIALASDSLQLHVQLRPVAINDLQQGFLFEQIWLLVRQDVYQEDLVVIDSKKQQIVCPRNISFYLTYPIGGDTIRKSKSINPSQ